MRRIIVGLLVFTVALLAWLSIPARAADSPLTGNWKVTVLPAGREITVWLVQIEDKDGKPQAKLLATGMEQFKDSTLESIRTDDKTVHLAFKAQGVVFSIVGHLPAGEKMPKKVLGSIEVSGNREFIQLERTDVKELDPAKATVIGPAVEDLKKALGTRDDKEREATLKDMLKKYPDQSAGYVAAQQLLAMAVHAGAEADAKSYAEQAIKTATPYGPEIKRNAILQTARALARSDKMAALYLDFARQGEKLLTAGDSAAQQVSILKTLASALKKNGKAEELKPIEARIAKLDEQLDQEFLKNAMPFKPEAFAGRKAKSDRVVLVELFTGAQCPPCVAADVAFDAMLKTYKPADVIFLQYHLHIPGPDPLTNKDAERRAELYGVEGTPTIYIDGKDGPPMGGGQAQAEGRYKGVRKLVDEQLEAAAGAQLKLTAQRKGEAIDIQAEIADLKKTGDNIRLRFVIVEELVRYPGTNGQRLHHHVVRGLPGRIEGIALQGKTGKHNLSVNLTDLRKTLNDYLTEYAKDPGFIDDERPLDLRQLKVVALIQDQSNKEILQAAQVDVKE